MSAVDIVVVNWNGGRLIEECVSSVDALPAPALDLIANLVVVDNGSTDGSEERLRAPNLGSRFRVFRNAENRGFAAACNQGAAVGSAEFILFLNPDTRVFATSLSTPIEFLRDPERANVGIVGVQLLESHGDVARSCARFPTFAGYLARMIALDRVAPAVFRPHFMAEWPHDENRPVDQVMGAFFLVRRDLFTRLGGFDERFFVYMEEVDFSIRAAKSGFSTWFLADAKVVHEGQGTTRQIKATRLFYSIRSRLLYGFKHFPQHQAVALAALSLTVEPATRLVQAVLGRSESSPREILKASRLLWTSLPDTLRTASRLSSRSTEQSAPSRGTPAREKDG